MYVTSVLFQKQGRKMRVCLKLNINLLLKQQQQQKLSPSLLGPAPPLPTNTLSSMYVRRKFRLTFSPHIIKTPSCTVAMHAY